MSFLPDRTLIRRVLKICTPAVAGLSSQMAVSVIETAMVGRLENTQVVLAAMGIAMLATWAVTSFFSSLATGIHVLSARRFGEEDFRGAGEVLNNSFLLVFLFGGAFGMAGFYFSYEILHLFSSDTAVALEGTAYMQWRFVGLVFFLFVVSCRGFFNGIGHTRVFMFSAIIVNFANILFDYFFIFGTFGFPRMGLAGAGCSFLVSHVIGCLFFLTVTFLPLYRRTYRYYSSFTIKSGILTQIIRIAAPVSFQNILILIGFLLFVSITGMIGTAEQAASQVVITAMFISFLPCFGFGIGAQTLVGQSIGNGNRVLARRYGLETAKIATYFTIVLGAIFVLVPDIVIQLITTNDDIAGAARPLLRLAGATQVFYAGGIVLAHALQAAGATLYVMMIEVLTHWIIFLPMTYLFGVTLGWGIMGAWLALPVYIVSYSALIYMKYRQDSWLFMKV